MARPAYPNNVKDSSGQPDSVQPVAVVGFYLDPDQPATASIPTGTPDGGDVAVGARADAAWNGNGAASLISILKGVFAGIAALAPAKAAVAVVPSDSANLATPSRALWVGTAGDISLQMNGNTVIHRNVQAGTRLDVVATRVNATGTTAGSIVAWS